MKLELRSAVTIRLISILQGLFLAMGGWLARVSPLVTKWTFHLLQGNWSTGNFRTLSLLKESYEFQNNYLINTSKLVYLCSWSAVLWSKCHSKKEQINKFYTRKRTESLPFTVLKDIIETIFLQIKKKRSVTPMILMAPDGRFLIVNAGLTDSA